ncbi:MULTISPECIES: hypothetical protein [unclassified Rhodococcus (in: high G+C Gram-positive bacteria)]|uniref:hypothetical protein n=1 Tax=unclassified Rhodococcus (in: high G+C Gram-positive bacteria) TaxID=192944 RepID=UPI0007BB3B41|nr:MULTISPECIES: hypothetical protein [unclassified Rhodococcus (in: high G+C Gram-positive bacteria)]KZF03084.1 hypothetical protein A2J04_06370 [Rhodococcus sp. EPR-279]KZF09729.1 hypothetical protein A2J02_18190 [Rhodococcus sp. EPR-147]OZE37692.1 hypothetical protein CH259_12740 [Rhodococcus sp. 05-2254-4]OZE40824.1 hypothetical protein CH261_27705 [Rhodococcus sp. 05-2254-3]OZE45815.1 hypothetical protein CH283_26360 [Rhodococcus sp. 05-2254-2]
MVHKTVRRVSTILALTAAAVTSVAVGTASADTVSSPLTLETYSLPQSGFCAAKIDVSIRPGAESNSYVIVGPDVQYLGIGPCNLTATLSWKELATGRTGSDDIPVTSGLVNYGLKTFSGHGAVEYTLTTNGPHTTDRATGTVQIP